MTERSQPISTIFSECYNEVAEEHNGAFIPQKAAKLLTTRTNRPDSYSRIHQTFARPETKQYIYDDVLPTLSFILSNPSHAITIWTQGELHTEGLKGYQMQKIAKSGVNEALGREWRERANVFDLPRVIGGLDKLQLLPTVYQEAASRNLQHVMIIDDKLSNLDAALTQNDDRRVHLHTFHIQRKESTPHPDHIPLRSLAELPIASFAHLPTWWLFDLDYTLLDHGKVKGHLVKNLEEILR